MHPAFIELLRGLGRLGGRAAAAAVDTALEEAEVVVKEVQTRIARGRQQAQTINKRQTKPFEGEINVVDVDATEDEDE